MKLQELRIEQVYLAHVEGNECLKFQIDWDGRIVVIEGSKASPQQAEQGIIELVTNESTRDKMWLTTEAEKQFKEAVEILIKEETNFYTCLKKCWPSTLLWRIVAY